MWELPHGITWTSKLLRTMNMNNANVPKTPHEHKVVLLLGMCGIKRDRLTFSETRDNERYFSFGHWLPIRPNDIGYVEKHSDMDINEISWYDEDCGWQCYYLLTHNSVEN